MKNSLILLFLVAFTAWGQWQPLNGVERSKPTKYALKNARIVVSPEKTIPFGTLLVEGDRIMDVGMIEFIPEDAVVIDCEGLTIYPSFIETWSNTNMPIPFAKDLGPYPQLESAKPGPYYWNDAVHPEVDAASVYQPDVKSHIEWQKMGFGTALTHVMDGIFRGSAALVSLGNNEPGKYILNPSAASILSFDKGVSRQTYPSSQMGSIALIRQVFYDLDWYTRVPKDRVNLSLDALSKQHNLPFIFETKDKWELMRAAKISKEFGLNMHYLGSGNEYAAIEQLKQIKGTVILPLLFPEAFDVVDPYVSRQIPLADLKHWELAPYNAKLLNDEGISICISAMHQKDAASFWKNLRKAISCGLPEEEALKALTVTPANMIGMGAELGTIEKGKKAHFTVYAGNPFEGEVKVLESWSSGERIIHELPEKNKIAGRYKINIEKRLMHLEISGAGSALEGKIQGPSELRDPKTNALISDTFTAKANVKLVGNDLTIQFNCNDGVWKGSVNLHGKVMGLFGVLEGEGQLPDGRWVQWTGMRKEKADEKEVKKNDEQVADIKKNIWYPNMAYGFTSEEKPERQTIVFQNATVWTNDDNGVLKNATVAVSDGKIVYVGTGYYPPPPNARIINADGKHLTSGIIDEHSHIAISKGVNEGGQAVSAEVSIGDVVSPDDINIYRQLAGGVTAAQLLHGSANPIGGQSALIKLKWGKSPEEMLIPNAPKFIKCALGENVKQSNWGDYNTVRFPQTRMGVEQVFYDGFNRARAYEQEWRMYSRLQVPDSSKRPRRDLELEVLLEILKSERFITCHSYVQSEINMLMHVADSLGFRINTFTHILEGYKLADKMKKHGAGASTFSDWWAYKFEVNDAIPYNAKLMHDQGLIVAINSDDAEMGRRLNQEAAKAVKYGGMSETDAWKMVTLYPAKLLHLDDRMGSVTAGKDGDLVLWSDHPLSIQAKVEITAVDGEVLFDAERDKQMQVRVEEERARLVSAMLEVKDSGEKVQPFVKKKSKRYHCDTLGEEGSTGENAH